MLAIAAGIASFIWPVFGVTMVTWTIVILMLAIGLVNIFTYVRYGRVEKHKSALGGGSLLLGILLAVFAILAMVFPGIRAGMDIFIVVLFAVNLFFNGIDMMFGSAAVKTQTNSDFAPFMMVLGFLMFIAGIMCICSLFTAALTFGFVMGVSMLVFGFTMLCSSSARIEQ